MNARRFVIALACAVAVGLAVVHVRTRVITLGYRLAAGRSANRRLNDTVRKQQLQLDVLSSAASVEERLARTPVDLVEPEHAVGFETAAEPADEETPERQGWSPGME